MELLNSAYTIHPAFGEAEIVEIGGDVRPTFPDNLPRIVAARPHACPSTASIVTASCSRRRLASRAADVVMEDCAFSGAMMLIIRSTATSSEVAAQTLAALLDELGYGDATVATALNRLRAQKAIAPRRSSPKATRSKSSHPEQGG